MKMRKMVMSGLFLGGALLLAPVSRAGAELALAESSCLACHKAQPQTLMGEWQHVAMKSATIQLKTDGRTEIVIFDKERVKLVNTVVKGDQEKMLRSIGEGAEVTVRFMEKEGVKEATTITVKPPVKLAAKEKMTLVDLEKLVAQGPEKGRYLLVDSRPERSFREGTIPTAASIPFNELAKEAGVLPVDRKRLLIFFGDDEQSRMGTQSMRKARSLGYKNAKVLVEGMQGWLKRNSGVICAAALADVYRDVPHVTLDARQADATTQDFVKGAAAFAVADAKTLKALPKKELKAPVIVYDADGKGNAHKIASEIVKAGQGKVLVLAGGLASARKAGIPLEKGGPGMNISYKPTPLPGSFPMDDFSDMIAAIPADTLILDVRNREELKDGTIKGSLNIPAQETFKRAAEIPRDKRVIAYCNSGARAEMAYHILKAKGFDNVYFLKAHVDFDNGKPDIY